MEVCANPMSYKAIGNMASKLRTLCGVQDIYYFPIVEFIEWILGNPDTGIDIYIVTEEEMKTAYGITNTGNRSMMIREDVYIRAANGGERDRFTLCHEVGHHFLHQPECIGLARGEIPKYQRPEWQANAFAALLMAPYNLVHGMDYMEIAERCGMSLQASQIHVDNLRRFYS